MTRPKEMPRLLVFTSPSRLLKKWPGEGTGLHRAYRQLLGNPVGRVPIVFGKGNAVYGLSAQRELGRR